LKEYGIIPVETIEKNSLIARIEEIGKEN